MSNLHFDNGEEFDDFGLDGIGPDDLVNYTGADEGEGDGEYQEGEPFTDGVTVIPLTLQSMEAVSVDFIVGNLIPEAADSELHSPNTFIVPVASGEPASAFRIK